MSVNKELLRVSGATRVKRWGSHLSGNKVTYRETLTLSSLLDRIENYFQSPKKTKKSAAR